jgi:excisionase family DNA binding protein
MLDDRMLSVRQVAELDGTSEDTVRREIKRGGLKATKLSARRIGVRKSDWRAARKA